MAYVIEGISALILFAAGCMTVAGGIDRAVLPMTIGGLIISLGSALALVIH